MDTFAKPFACLGIIRENVQGKTIVLSPNFLSRAIYPAPVELLLGPLYTRSGCRCSTQITHSYWCKSWNQPKGLNYNRSEGWNRKNLFNLPQVTNKCWILWYWPQGWRKGYHQISETNFQPLWPMLWHLFVTWAQTKSPKCSNLAPNVFSALTSTVKQALD